MEISAGVLSVQKYPHFNASEKLTDMSAASRDIFFIVNQIILSGIVGVFGIVSNVINIVVFVKQGLDTTINIGLFGLAVSDLCSIVLLLYFCIGGNPLTIEAAFPVNILEILYLTAGWPQKCFSRITTLITVYVSAERCLCILAPLRVKRLITPTKTSVIICFIYTTMVLALAPEYIRSYIGPTLDLPGNTTSVGLVYTRYKGSLKGVAFMIQAVLAIISFVTLVFLTGTLVWSLKRNQARRKSFASGTSTRETRAILLVVMIATLLIICYSPGAILFFISFIVKDFSVDGAYPNLFFACWSFAFLGEVTNSSVNIFFYYRMSSRYKKTLLPMLRKWKRRTKSECSEPAERQHERN